MPAAGSELETICQLETTVDDMSPQLWEPVIETLFEAGALDVYLAPVIMKRSRPGVVLTALCNPARVAELARTLLEASTTIGVRWTNYQRRRLPREMVSLSPRPTGRSHSRSRDWTDAWSPSPPSSRRFAASPRQGAARRKYSASAPPRSRRTRRRRTRAASRRLRFRKQDGPGKEKALSSRPESPSVGRVRRLGPADRKERDLHAVRTPPQLPSQQQLLGFSAPVPALRFTGRGKRRRSGAASRGVAVSEVATPRQGRTP